MKFKLIVFYILPLMFFSCRQASDNEINNNKTTHKVQTTSTNTGVDVKDNFTYKTTFSLDTGWGYQILNNGELYINQPHIPAINGVKGFTDEQKAIKTAELMIYKLNNGIFPPTISIEELDSLNVLDE